MYCWCVGDRPLLTETDGRRLMACGIDVSGSIDGLALLVTTVVMTGW